MGENTIYRISPKALSVIIDMLKEGKDLPMMIKSMEEVDELLPYSLYDGKKTNPKAINYYKDRMAMESDYEKIKFNIEFLNDSGIRKIVLVDNLSSLRFHEAIFETLSEDKKFRYEYIKRTIHSDKKIILCGEIGYKEVIIKNPTYVVVEEKAILNSPKGKPQVYDESVFFAKNLCFDIGGYYFSKNDKKGMNSECDAKIKRK